MGGHYINNDKTKVPPTTDWRINDSSENPGQHPPPSLSYDKVDGRTVHARRISLMVQSAEEGDINEIRRLIRKNPLLLDSKIDLVATVLAQKDELLASVAASKKPNGNSPPLHRLQSDSSAFTQESSAGRLNRLEVRRSPSRPEISDELNYNLQPDPDPDLQPTITRSLTNTKSWNPRDSWESTASFEPPPSLMKCSSWNASGKSRSDNTKLRITSTKALEKKWA